MKSCSCSRSWSHQLFPRYPEVSTLHLPAQPLLPFLPRSAWPPPWRTPTSWPWSTAAWQPPTVTATAQSWRRPAERRQSHSQRRRCGGDAAWGSCRSQRPTERGLLQPEAQTRCMGQWLQPERPIERGPPQSHLRPEAEVDGATDASRAAPAAGSPRPEAGAVARVGQLPGAAPVALFSSAAYGP